MLENVLKSKWVSSPGNLFNANSVFQKIKLSWNAFVCMPEWSTGVVARMHTCARRCSETRIPKFRSVNAVNNSYRWPPTLATASSSTSSITKLSSWLKVDLLISLRGLAQAIALTTTTSKTLWQEWWHARCHQTDWYIKDALDSWMYEMGNVFGVSASRSATLSYFFWLHMGWGGVGLCSRSFNLHTLVMHTPWMLRYSWGGVGRGCVQVPSTCTRWWCTRHCVHVPSTCTRWWCTRHECYATHGVVWGGAVFTFLQVAHAGDAHAMNATLLMGWCGVGLCSRSFNLHTLVMRTPWMLRYSWGGVGWGCVQVPSTCTRWWCTRHECYATHGVVWGEAVVRFLLLAHAGDAHAMNATLLMGWCGWGCVHVPSSCTRWWCTRHECYATHGVVWGGAVFMFLQLAHAGDAHAMNATVLMGWCGVAVFMFLQLAHAGHGVGVGVGVGGVMLLTFNWSRTPTWCYAQLLHLHKRCHVGVERFWGMPLGGFGRLLTVNMIGCNRPRSAGLLWRFHAWLHWLGCQLVWRKYRVHIYIYIYIYKFANVHIRLCMYIHFFPNMHI